MFSEYSSLVLRPPPRWERAPNQGEINRSLAKIEGSVKDITDLVARLQIERQLENTADYKMRTSSLRIMKPMPGDENDCRNRHVSFSFPVRNDCKSPEGWSSSDTIINAEYMLGLKPKPNNAKPILNSSSKSLKDDLRAKINKQMNSQQNITTFRNSGEYATPATLQIGPKSDGIKFYKKLPSFDHSNLSALPPPSPKSFRNPRSRPAPVRLSPDLNLERKNNVYKSLSLQPQRNYAVEKLNPADSSALFEFSDEEYPTLKRKDKLTSSCTKDKKESSSDLEDPILEGHQDRNDPENCFSEFHQQYTEAMKILEAYEVKKSNQGEVEDYASKDISSLVASDEESAEGGKDKKYDTLKSSQKAKAQKEYVVGDMDVYNNKRIIKPNTEIENDIKILKEESTIFRPPSSIWSRIKNRFNIFWTNPKRKSKEEKEDDYYRKHWAKIPANAKNI